MQENMITSNLMIGHSRIDNAVHIFYDRRVDNRKHKRDILPKQIVNHYFRMKIAKRVRKARKIRRTTLFTGRASQIFSNSLRSSEMNLKGTIISLTVMFDAPAE